MTALGQLSLAAVVAAATYYVVHLGLGYRRMKGAKPPPGPKGWPFIGNALELATSNGNLIPIFNKWAKQYGPIVQFGLPGETHAVLSDDRIANKLFVKRGSIYSGRGAPHAIKVITQDLNPAFRCSSFAARTTETWRRERKLIHTAVSITTNTKYQGFMAEEATLTLNDVLKTLSDFSNHFLRYSYGVLTRSILGFRVMSADDAFVVKSERTINEATKCFRPDEYPSNLFPFLRVLPKWLVPSLGKLEVLRKGIVEEQAELRRDIEKSIAAGSAPRNSVYRHFLENRSEYAVTDLEAAYTFNSMIGGGTRSPQNALLTFVYLMMEFPEWMAKLQAQVDAVVGPDRLPTFDDIPQLPVVRAIVKEGIRYRTIMAELGIPHRLDQDDVFEGYFFAKGTIIHANYAAILMDKKTYPDQQPFNPARWLDPAYAATYREPLTIHPNCQNFTPFGYGRRACPGYDFAERTLVIMVAQLAWACDIRKPVDPATKRPITIRIEYEPVPNPRPRPFPCEIVPRSDKRIDAVRRAAAALVVRLTSLDHQFNSASRNPAGSLHNTMSSTTKWCKKCQVKVLMPTQPDICAQCETINRGPLSPPSEVLRLLSKERKQNPPKPEPPPQQKVAAEAVTADSLTSASTSDSPKPDKLCWVCQRVNTSDGDSCNDCMTGTMFEG
ncbi:cytochrome P450 [Lasiosphaeria miniovina]|uniref:Cytochrome P450 n=1 Tax=Lasiosphaeria miniovina TaxID=1954250 RepID=A0AA40A6A9_9PEZI|nr:cytochrome P450 [Lasiosphaeria miniovina]KAK0709948.1 cytochrome P450 [Lasiosphaeria miniovina]